jgi:lipopolysaccharide heptosyltransferase II
MGDALTATPALRALRQTWPWATIDVLTSAAGAAALDGLDSVNHRWLADKHRFDTPAGLLSPSSLLALLPLLARLRGERYDQLLLLHHLTTRFGAAKYALLGAAIHARRTIGLDNGRGGFLDVCVPDNGFGNLHEVDYGLSVAAAAGAARPSAAHLEITIDSGSEHRAAELLVGSRMSEWIALHAGGGSYSLARRWPVEHFAEVGRRLAETTGARLVIVGTEVDAESSRRLGDLLQGAALNLVGQTSVKETAAVLRGCRLLVSNDSGAVHLASAAGTPVVAVFGPSNDRAWGPYPPNHHRVVRASLPCSPCFYRGKQLGTPQGCPTRECLQLVSVDMVVAAAEDLLRQPATAAV